MDLILIILFLVIVICMGYILCKPFFESWQVQEPTNEEAYLEIKYQMLVLEIKRIKSECEAGAIPKEDCKAQLSKLKKEATSLMLLLDLDPSELQDIFPKDNDLYESPEDRTALEEIYCPQCGELIETSDKFCMHCGQNL